MKRKINLSKGEKIDLDKGMTHAMIGLGWKAKDRAREDDIDLDASVFLLDENDQLANITDIVFYKLPAIDKSTRVGKTIVHPSGAVIHSGDDRTGGNGEDDNEVIYIDFSKIPDYVEKLNVVVSIYKWKKRHQNFGMVKKAYVRMASVDDEHNITDDAPELRFDLAEDQPTSCSMLMASITRHGENWKFEPIGEGKQGGLGSFIEEYGYEFKGDD